MSNWDTGTPSPSEPSDSSQAGSRAPVEPGALLRSPGPSKPTWSGTPVTDFPWDDGADHESSAYPPRVAAGPIVRTERLYRSASFPNKSIAESPLPDAEPAPPAQVPTAALDNSDQPEMLGPMTVATQPPGYEDSELSGSAGQVINQPADTQGVGTLAVIFIIGGITTAVGFIDMLLHQQFTWIVGIAFIIACAIAALTVRRSDLWTAVITAPLAYLGALIIAGQPSTLDGSGDLLLREISLIATGLAFNAPYVFGGTAVALIIVLVRRSRFRD